MKDTILHPIVSLVTGVLASLFARLQLAFNVGQVIVNERRVLLAESSELLLHGFEFCIRHVVELNKTGSGSLDPAQEFIQLERHNFGLSVLRILDEEYHQESDDRRPGVDKELPGVRKFEIRALEAPCDDGEHRNQKGPGRSHGVGHALGPLTKQIAHVLAPLCPPASQ